MNDVRNAIFLHFLGSRSIRWLAEDELDGFAVETGVISCVRKAIYAGFYRKDACIFVPI